jgi:hypothetical protein
VLVLPFFFGAVSAVAADTVAAVASAADVADVTTVGGELALLEARRFRGFAGDEAVAA